MTAYSMNHLCERHISGHRKFNQRQIEVASAVIVDSVFIVPHMFFAFINIRIFSLKEVMPND